MEIQVRFSEESMGEIPEEQYDVAASMELYRDQLENALVAAFPQAEVTVLVDANDDTTIRFTNAELEALIQHGTYGLSTTEEQIREQVEDVIGAVYNSVEWAVAR